MKFIDKVTNYYKEHGAKGVAWRVMEKLTGIRPGAISYSKWIAQNTPDERELARQGDEQFGESGMIIYDHGTFYGDKTVLQ